MTRRELITFCKTLPDTYEDYPFDSIKDGTEWTVMRHSKNKKSFAMIYERHGKLCVNLKCEPNEADFLRGIFIDLIPAYHMNKIHWNTVFIGGDVPDEEVKKMTLQSYNLIKPKVRSKKEKNNLKKV
jgi:predicted DNA-binding protein (MmcQ/YjbR family)